MKREKYIIVINARITSKTYIQLEKRAEKDGDTPSALIRKAINKYLNN